MTDVLLTPEEIAARSRLSVKSVYLAIQSGELRAAKIRSRWRITERDFADWIRRCTYAPALDSDASIPPPPSFGESDRASLTILRAIESGQA